jgi:hypothetical protein
MVEDQKIHYAARWWFVGYIGLVALVVSLMFYARQSAITQLSSSQSISAWQAWREDVRNKQSQPKLVERRVPKSEEPPELVLMRDYFGVLMFGALLFSSALYLVMAWFITGVASGSRIEKN